VVDYLLVHVCDHAVDRDRGLYHLAAVPMLVLREQVDDEQHIMDIVFLFVVLEHVVDNLMMVFLIEQGDVHLSFFVRYHLM
jgi:hypothetical protein